MGFLCFEAERSRDGFTPLFPGCCTTYLVFEHSKENLLLCCNTLFHYLTLYRRFTRGTTKIAFDAKARLLSDQRGAVPRISKPSFLTSFYTRQAKIRLALSFLAPTCLLCKLCFVCVLPEEWLRSYNYKNLLSTRIHSYSKCFSF